MKHQNVTAETRKPLAFDGKESSENKAENLVDLTIEGETTNQVKGGPLIGLLLPAVQKIR